MQEYSKTSFLIIGTSHEARIALDIAQQLEVLVLGFLTDDPEEVSREINDMLIVAALGTKDSDTLLADENIKLVVADGDLSNRKDLLAWLDDKAANLVNLFHPQQSISASAIIGRSNIAGPGWVFGANAVMGDHNYIGAYVSIGVDTHMGDYCTLQDGVRVGPEVTIENEAFIGMGAIIHKGVTIGKGAAVAAGSVVLQDVPAGTSVFGNPAKLV